MSTNFEAPRPSQVPAEVSPRELFRARQLFQAALAAAWWPEMKPADDNERSMMWFLRYAEAFSEVFEREGKRLSPADLRNPELLPIWQQKLDEYIAAKEQLAKDLAKLQPLD